MGVGRSFSAGEGVISATQLDYLSSICKNILKVMLLAVVVIGGFSESEGD